MLFFVCVWVCGYVCVCVCVCVCPVSNVMYFYYFSQQSVTVSVYIHVMYLRYLTLPYHAPRKQPSLVPSFPLLYFKSYPPPNL